MEKNSAGPPPIKPVLSKRSQDEAELNYLNKHHQFPFSCLESFSNPDTVSGGLRNKLGQVLRRTVLSVYTKCHTEYNANLVRFLNKLASKLDTASYRVDDDIRASFCSVEKRIDDTVSRSEHRLVERLAAVEQRISVQEDAVSVLDSVTRGLERILCRMSGSGSRDAALSVAAKPIEDLPDYSYLLLENRFRGSEESVKLRLSIYPAMFKHIEKPVLEIGAGRGELQCLFRENGVTSYGLETDAAMVEVSLAKNVDVRLEEGLSHLQSLDDGSLGGVIAVQVVEHLPLPALKRLLELCLSKVSPGGKVVFETINTASLSALCSNYFRDPSHAQPLHPETMRFMLETSGFRVLEVRELSRYPEEAMLQPVPVEAYMTPRWAAAVERINRNMEQLNKLLFGAQDYCIVAQVDLVAAAGR